MPSVDFNSADQDIHIRGDNGVVGGRSLKIGRQDVAGREDTVNVDIPRSRFTVDGRPIEFVTNVRLYEAEGDGATDDTASIQAAMDAAATAGASRVVFPAGTYLISSTITLPLIEGNDSVDGVVVIQGDGAKIKTTSDTTMFRLPETANTSGFRAPVIEGFMFEGDSQSNQVAINLKKTYLPSVRNCRFLNLHTGILGEFVIGLQVENCHSRYVEKLIHVTDLSGTNSTYAHVQACRAYSNSATAVPYDINAPGMRLESCISEGVECDIAYRLSGYGTVDGCHIEATTIATSFDLDVASRARFSLRTVAFGGGSLGSTLIDTSRSVGSVGGSIRVVDLIATTSVPNGTSVFKHTDGNQSSNTLWSFDFGGLASGGSSGAADWVMDPSNWDSGKLPLHLDVKTLTSSNQGIGRWQSNEYRAAFTDGDTSPDVTVHATSKWKTANTSSTTITTFDAGGSTYPSEIDVFIDDVNTGISESGTLVLDGTAGNFAAGSKALFRFFWDGSRWREISRTIY